MDLSSSIQIIPVDIKIKLNYKYTIRSCKLLNMEVSKVKNKTFCSESSKVTPFNCFMYSSKKVSIPIPACLAVGFIAGAGGLVLYSFSFFPL